MAARPIHRERPAPVMADQDDVVRHVELFEQPVDETTMLQEAITIRIGAFQLFRVSHANEVRRDAAGLRRYMRHDIAPDIGRSRIAVQEDDRRPAAELRIGHLLAKHLAELLCWFFDGKHRSNPPSWLRQVCFTGSLRRPIGYSRVISRTVFPRSRSKRTGSSSSTDRAGPRREPARGSTWPSA